MTMQYMNEKLPYLDFGQIQYSDDYFHYRKIQGSIIIMPTGDGFPGGPGAHLPHICLGPRLG